MFNVLLSLFTYFSRHFKEIHILSVRRANSTTFIKDKYDALNCFYFAAESGNGGVSSRPVTIYSDDKP